ncbi:MAG: hypothetical protein ACOYJR_00745 [Acutalibacteraceae bacterium]|jgi:uncharacterized protein (UPF0333 family)
MKLMKKIAAAALAMLMAFSATACSNVGSWIVKTNSREIPVGIYIAYLQSAYASARYMTEDVTASPIGQTVTVDDEKIDAETWMKNQALDASKKLLTVLDLCDAAKITLTDEEQSAINESVDTAWDSNSSSYEKIGIAKTSLKDLYQFSKLSEKHFDSIYGANGTSAVSDSDVKEYFTKNYSSIKYFSVSLKDSSGNALGTEDQQKIETELNGVKDSYEKGDKTFSEIVDEYNAKHSSAKVNMSENITVLTKSYAEDFYKNLTSVKAGKATVFTYGNYMYVVAMYDIEKETDYLKNNASTIRHAIKDTEYTELIEKEMSNRTFTVNEAAQNKYSPSWMEKSAG